jgi:hypothetical protein
MYPTKNPGDPHHDLTMADHRGQKLPTDEIFLGCFQPVQDIIDAHEAFRFGNG